MKALRFTIIIFSLGWLSGITYAQVVAVTADEIRKYGITTNDVQNCTDTSYIPVFAEPELENQIAVISPHRFVKFERFSEMFHVAPWAPKAEYRLSQSGGEKFKISYDNVTGWIGENKLMTFSSQWKENETEYFIKIFKYRTAVCIFSSGQYETSFCNAVTAWKLEDPEHLWKLKDVLFNSVPQSLYSTPRIDSIFADKKGGLHFRVSAIGGDAGDVWGSRVSYSFDNDTLSVDRIENK
jgi:hypothetical protein